jgi:Dolichyl-phosphate-mannose-protein mannosyltransferase
MSAAETAERPPTRRAQARSLRSRRRRGRAWFALALLALLAGALVLRLVGFESGLPFVYNADENAHFVPRAIGMFGHSLNPNYFINPPGYTYLLHLAFLVRWGGRDTVGAAFASDPTTAFAIARAACAVCGVAAVGLLVWAGVRLLEARAAGLIAGLLLAVAFLPVNYSHLALNDVPTLVGVTLSLVGTAGVYRRGRLRDFALGGVGVGLACATKYTGGIVVLPLLTAVAVAPRLSVRRRIGGLVLAGVLAGLAFFVANPYSVLDSSAFREGLRQQSEASGDDAGKLGQTYHSGYGYYLWTLTWGFGWVPLLLAVGGAVWLALREWRLALVLVPAPLVLLVFLGGQERYWARWLLPAYPLLCLLAAAGAVALAGGVAAVVRRPWARGVALAVVACVAALQGLVLSIHNDHVLTQPDTRALAREWLVAHTPEGAKMVVEPVFPDQWAMDPGHPSAVTGNGNRWRKWPTSRSLVNNDGTLRKGVGRVVKLEDYERTTRPQLVDAYVKGGYCWVVTGSTQFGRAQVAPEQVPNALRYYAELRRRADVVYRVAPWEGKPVRFSFDDSFNYRPLAYERPGPEIVVYRLRGCTP